MNFTEVPAWQRRGSGLYYEAYEKEGLNPKTGQIVLAQRRRVRVDSDLPMGEEYSAMVRQVVGSAAELTAPRS